MVHRVHLPAFRAADIGMAQGVFADRLVECEPVHSPARGIYKHGGRPINNITRGHLLMPLLQKIFLCGRLAQFAHPAEDAEDGADRHIHINIAAAIERIEEADIFTVIAHVVVKYHDIVKFLAADACATDPML